MNFKKHVLPGRLIGVLIETDLTSFIEGSECDVAEMIFSFTVATVDECCTLDLSENAIKIAQKMRP